MLKAVFIACLLACAGTWYWIENRQTVLRVPTQSGVDYILNLPLKDKKRLDFLFRELICYNDFGYTLFDGKPLSLAGCPKPFLLKDWPHFRESIRPRYIKMYLGWKTWLKYQHLFQNPKFIIWAEKSPWWGEEGVVILIANREKVQSVVDIYSDYFRYSLQYDNASTLDLLSEIPNRQFLQETLKSHEGLIGTLLGYGYHNSSLFCEKEGLGRNSMVPIWSIGDQVSQKENEKMAFYLPSFMVNPESDETKQIRNEFKTTQKKLSQYYNNDDSFSFLEKTLALLRI